MIEVSAQNVMDLQNKGEKILVQLSASWCGPCKTLSPRLDQLSNDYENITFVKVDVDQNMDYAKDLEVRSVPTVLIFDGATLVNRSTGVQSDKYYKDILKTI
jgi:thioredoxin 1